MSGDHPLLKERKIDLEKLARADAAGVHSYLTEQVNNRAADVITARQEFIADPDRVFDLPDLVAGTSKTLGVESSTVYGRIISDYISDEAKKHLLSSIAKGILALALTFLVPVGGWVAAGALLAGGALSTYEAYQAYTKYQEEERDYELGFLQEEPSLIWVGLAIVGAAADIGGVMTAAKLLKESATALKTLKKPLLQFAEDGELAPLLAKIEAAEGLNIKLKAALDREAKLSTAATNAWKAARRGSGNPSMVIFGADIGVVKNIFHALYLSIRGGINDFVKFSAYAKRLKIMEDITGLSGAAREELEIAFEEVKKLVDLGRAKGMDWSSVENFVGRWAINRGKPGFQTKLLDEINTWKPLTQEQIRTQNALKAQQAAVETLIGRKKAVEEELKELLTKVDKTEEEIIEVRKLEKELRDLDPQSSLLKETRVGKVKKGQIFMEEKALEEAEAAAERAALSLYDRIRNSKPSLAAREKALKQPHVEDIAGPVKGKPSDKQVDHIVSVREIVDMDGFADLTRKQQKEIVHMQKNLIWMDGSANASKGEGTWRSWANASNYYETAGIDNMAEIQTEVRRLIEEEIKNQLNILKTKK